MVSPNNDESSPRRSRGRPRDWHDKSAQNTIKSLDRAIEVLDHLSQRPGQSLSALAADLKQSPATIYRVLVTFERRGLVEFDPREQLWHVGAQTFVIGGRFLRRTSLVDRARPILRELMEATGETANLGIERSGSVLFVSQVETQESIRAFFPPGTLSPMHASGIGKALLAEMDEKRLDRILKQSRLEVFTPFTLSDPTALKADLGVAQVRGYSLDGEEKNLGMRCIAAPVFDMHGEAVAGLSVSGPTSRVTEDRIGSISDAVMQAAQELTRAIGGTPARISSRNNGVGLSG